MCFAIPKGRASTTDFATVVSTAVAAVVALYIAITGSRASPTSPTNFATHVLCNPKKDELQQQTLRLLYRQLWRLSRHCTLQSQEAELHQLRQQNFATDVLCNPKRTDFNNRLCDCCIDSCGGCRGTVLCNHRKPSFTNFANKLCDSCALQSQKDELQQQTLRLLYRQLWRLSWHCTLQSQEAELHQLRQQTLRLMCFAIPKGRASTTDFATVVSTAVAAVVALYFAITGSRASPTSPTNFATHVLCNPKRTSFNNRLCDCCIDSCGGCRGTVLCNHRKPSFTNFANKLCDSCALQSKRTSFKNRLCDCCIDSCGGCRGTVLCNHRKPSFTNFANKLCDSCALQSQNDELQQQTLRLLYRQLWRLSWHCTLQSQEAELHQLRQQTLRLMCFAIPKGRASTTDFATVVSTAVAAVVALYFAITGSRASPTSPTNFATHVLCNPKRTSFNNRLCDCCIDSCGGCRGTVLCNHRKPSFTNFANKLCDSCALQSQKDELQQQTLRLLYRQLWRLSWHCTLQSQEAELHQLRQQTLRLMYWQSQKDELQQKTLRLLYRQLWRLSWHCTLQSQEAELHQLRQQTLRLMCFAIPKRRASTTDFATVVSTAVADVVALYFAITRIRASTTSPTKFATHVLCNPKRTSFNNRLCDCCIDSCGGCRGTVLCNHRKPSFTNFANKLCDSCALQSQKDELQQQTLRLLYRQLWQLSWHCTLQSQEAELHQLRQQTLRLMCFAIPKGRASTTDFATVVSTAVAAVVALYFAITGSRASPTSPTNFATHVLCNPKRTSFNNRLCDCCIDSCGGCRGTVLCNHKKPSFTNFANKLCDSCALQSQKDELQQQTLRLLYRQLWRLSWRCTLQSQEAELHQLRQQTLRLMCFAIPKGRASTTDFATVVSTAVAAVVALYFAITRSRASPTSPTNFATHVLCNPKRTSFNNRLCDCCIDSCGGCRGTVLCNHRKPSFTNFANKLCDSCALQSQKDELQQQTLRLMCFAIPKGRASTTDFATVVSTAVAAVVALYFAITGSRASPTSPTNFATHVLCNPKRTSFNNRLCDCCIDSCGGCVRTVLCNHRKPSFTNFANKLCDSCALQSEKDELQQQTLRLLHRQLWRLSWHCTLQSQEAELHQLRQQTLRLMCFAIPKGRASTTDFATVVSTAVAAVVALNSAITGSRASPTSPTNFATHVLCNPKKDELQQQTLRLLYRQLWRLSWHCTLQSQEAEHHQLRQQTLRLMCFAIPKGRASTTDFATVVSTAVPVVFVVAHVLDREDPASPGGSTSSETLMTSRILAPETRTCTRRVPVV